MNKEKHKTSSVINKQNEYKVKIEPFVSYTKTVSSLLTAGAVRLKVLQSVMTGQRTPVKSGVLVVGYV